MPEARTERPNVETLWDGRNVDWHAVLQTALNSPGQIGQTYSRFHSYSYLNQILLLAQGARGPVASYKRWQSLGRQVMKGERGYEIVRPITVKARDQLDEHGEPKTFTRFKLVRGAFTYSQTSGEELPAPEIPTWDYHRALGKLAIEEAPFDSIEGNAAGYATERRIAINPVAKYPVKTRFHELAHVVLNHTAPATQVLGAPRGLHELEAEGTAYLCMNELGLQEFFDPAESRAYIQNWTRGQKAPATSIRAIFKATDTILRAGYPDEAGDAVA